MNLGQKRWISINGWELTNKQTKYKRCLWSMFLRAVVWIWVIAWGERRKSQTRSLTAHMHTDKHPQAKKQINTRMHALNDRLGNFTQKSINHLSACTIEQNNGNVARLIKKLHSANWTMEIGRTSWQPCSPFSLHCSPLAFESKRKFLCKFQAGVIIPPC